MAWKETVSLCPGFPIHLCPHVRGQLQGGFLSPGTESCTCTGGDRESRSTFRSPQTRILWFLRAPLVHSFNLACLLSTSLNYQSNLFSFWRYKDKCILLRTPPYKENQCSYLVLFPFLVIFLKKILKKQLDCDYIVLHSMSVHIVSC